MADKAFQCGAICSDSTSYPAVSKNMTQQFFPCVLESIWQIKLFSVVPFGLILQVTLQ